MKRGTWKKKRALKKGPLCKNLQNHNTTGRAGGQGRMPMEAQPIYGAEANDTCQHQNCQCRTCDNDHGGECAVDEGSCTEAITRERCPVIGCSNWKPKEAPHEQSN